MSIVKSIRIQNFKSLEDVKIDLSQLTLLFGANSSGKSSFLKALMFLSKNMLYNFNGLVNYQVSKDINLIDYRNVVRDNNVENQISFEVSLKGTHYFPEYEFIYNNMDRFGTVNIFKTLELSFERFYTEDACNYEDREFDARYNTTFAFHENHGVLRAIEIEDAKSNSKMIYSENSNNTYSTKFLLFGNEEISKVFNLHWDVFEFDKLYGFDYVLSDDFNRTNDEKGNPIFISEYWQQLSDEDKRQIYFEFIRFYHFSGSYVTQILMNFFKLIHLGITREVPKKIYVLRENRFDETEYYGLLNHLLTQSALMSLDNSKASYDAVKNSTQSEIENQRDHKWAYKNDLNFTIKSYKPASDRNWIVRSILLNVNKLLIEMGFELVIDINLFDNLAEIKLIGKSGFRCNIDHASSGIIQVLPIFIATSILVQNFSELGHLLSPKEEHPELHLFLVGGYFNPIRADYVSSSLKVQFNTILIEQPELHLHPKLQSDLAKIFADTVSIAAINSSLYIETHSEHLIRKLQVLIAKGELAREKVGVWYFKKVNGVTKVEKMEIDENGLFKNDWPDGFFDDSIELTMELFEALRKRKN